MPLRPVAVATVLALLTGAAIASPAPARAQSGEHGDGHAANHDWYKHLRTPQGYSCCKGDANGGDCRPVQARPRGDGQWEAYFGGAWQEVPRERILPDDLNHSPLHAHICEQDGYVRCFLRGGGGT
ncbi:MAG: hypothetical protein U1E60_07870 [Reyranellaceae bacterium]